MIVASNLTKRYAGTQVNAALSDVNFTINAGEFTFINGHSGAGKSTLLRLIAAIERPTSGSLLLNGKNLASLNARGIPFIRRNLGLIFQDQKLLFDRNALENVLLPLFIVGISYKEAVKRAHAALDKVGLLARAKANPIALSGGEQQKLAIARAVVNRPAMLLADEPTANLDDETAEHIFAIFRDFNQVGVTILIATHDLSKATKGARLLQLEQGKLIGQRQLL